MGFEINEIKTISRRRTLIKRGKDLKLWKADLIRKRRTLIRKRRKKKTIDENKPWIRIIWQTILWYIILLETKKQKSYRKL